MASTNKTTHYDLSQYVGSDKPTYLGDYNTDMSKIDTAINSAQTKADSADVAATTAQTTAEGAQTTANTAITNAATAQSGVNTNANNIGTLANLTTVEKTSLVGAINEVNDKEFITNSYSQLTNKGYSCDYLNNKLVDVYTSSETTLNKTYLGKTVKTITFTATYNEQQGGTITLINMPNINRLVMAYGYVKGSGGSQRQIPDSNVEIDITTNKDITLNIDNSFTHVEYEVTIEYTVNEN